MRVENSLLQGSNLPACLRMTPDVIVAYQKENLGASVHVFSICYHELIHLQSCKYGCDVGEKKETTSSWTPIAVGLRHFSVMSSCASRNNARCVIFFSLPLRNPSATRFGSP